MGQWFSKKKKFNDLAKFFHFYDYHPFEKDRVLYLNNSKFSSLKDDLYQFD
jgi:hypothetical protein